MEPHLYWETGASVWTDSEMLCVPPLFPCILASDTDIRGCRYLKRITYSSWFRVRWREVWWRMLGLMAPRKTKFFSYNEKFCHNYILIVLLIMCLCVRGRYVHMTAGAPESKKHQVPRSWTYSQLWFAPCGSWKLNCRFLAEQQALLTVEPFLQSHNCILKSHFLTEPHAV